MDSLSTFSRPEHVTQESVSRAEILVEPLVSLVDEKITIKAIGLPRDQRVTLRAKLTGDSDETFESYAHFIANGEGVVSVEEQDSRGGTYSGVDGLGLLWSMQASPGQRKGLRLSKKDVTKPYLVELQLFRGHVQDFHRDLQPTTSVTLEKWYMADEVQRIPVREGRVRGTLFLPPGDGPFPGVIDLFGTAGGLIEFKAALLASRGFAALALAYFAYDDLPTALTELELEYFNEAAGWMLAHPKVMSRGLGLMGVSKGSELVLSLAAIRSDIQAVVAISPAHAMVACPIKYKGKELDFLKFEPEFIKMSPNGAIIFKECYPPDVTDAPGRTAAIKVENIEGSILLICGADDQSWEAERMAKKIHTRLGKHGKATRCTLLCYPGTGHLIEPPCMPACTSSYHKSYRMSVEWGGQPRQQALAQEDSWQRILRFFSTKLFLANQKSRL